MSKKDCIFCGRKDTCERSIFRKKEKGFRMDSAMKKLKKIIDDVTDKGNKSKHKLSLFEISELILYFEDLWKCKSVMVIDEKLKDILVKCGFEATEDDIGWIVK